MGTRREPGRHRAKRRWTNPPDKQTKQVGTRRAAVVTEPWTLLLSAPAEHVLPVWVGGRGGWVRVGCGYLVGWVRGLWRCVGGAGAGAGAGTGAGAGAGAGVVVVVLVVCVGCVDGWRGWGGWLRRAGWWWRVALAPLVRVASISGRLELVRASVHHKHICENLRKVSSNVSGLQHSRGPPTKQKN